MIKYATKCGAKACSRCARILTNNAQIEGQIRRCLRSLERTDKPTKVEESKLELLRQKELITRP